MTIEMERAAETLRPRILETEETGRLELSPQGPPEQDLPSPRTRRSLLMMNEGMGLRLRSRRRQLDWSPMVRHRNLSSNESHFILSPRRPGERAG